MELVILTLIRFPVADKAIAQRYPAQRGVSRELDALFRVGKQYLWGNTSQQRILFHHINQTGNGIIPDKRVIIQKKNDSFRMPAGHPNYFLPQNQGSVHCGSF